MASSNAMCAMLVIRTFDPGISVHVTCTSAMGTFSACDRCTNSTSKAHRCSRWLGKSSRAAGRVSSCKTVGENSQKEVLFQITKNSKIRP